jgi:hypothetical protein
MRTIGLGGALPVLLALCACFDPPTANIAFQCGPNAACPERYECRDDGCCHLIGSTTAEVCTLTDARTSDTSTPDAPVDAPIDAPIDAPGPDAPIDAPMPDAEVPDAEVPDAEVPDAEVPDAEVPDAEVPDAA